MGSSMRIPPWRSMRMARSPAAASPAMATFRISSACHTNDFTKCLSARYDEISDKSGTTAPKMRSHLTMSAKAEGLKAVTPTRECVAADTYPTWHPTAIGTVEGRPLVLVLVESPYKTGTMMLDMSRSAYSVVAYIGLPMSQSGLTSSERSAAKTGPTTCNLLASSNLPSSSRTRQAVRKRARISTDFSGLVT